MILLYVILVVTIILLAWRINHPGDLRLNRRYLARYLKDALGRGPVRLQTTKLPVDRPTGAPEERAYYDIEAEFADESKRSVSVQIVYPLEELHQEREQRNLPSNGEASMMPGLTEMQSSFDVGARLKEDPFKDLATEEKVTAAKAAMVNREVDQLRTASVNGVVFPRLIAHDEQRLITITESVGKQRFDDVWQELDDAARRSMLLQLLQDIAVFHGRSADLAAILPPGPSHNERAMRESLYASLDNGLQLATASIQQALSAAGPLYATAQLEKGVRLANASPRGYFVRDGRARSFNWADLRRDVSALDVIELVCDPALGLSVEQEVESFTAYLDKLRENTDVDAETPTLVDLRRLAIYFQLVLVGHLALFQRGPNAVNSKSPLDIKHWPATSLSRVANKLLAHLQADDELRALLDLLAPVLRSLV